MEPWIWPLILLTVGLCLALLEVFVTTAGILALASAAMLVAAVIVGFHHGPGIGMTILGIIVVVTPTTVILAFRWWPHTSMGKQVLLDVPRAEDVLPDDADRRQLKT